MTAPPPCALSTTSRAKGRGPAEAMTSTILVRSTKIQEQHKGVVTTLNGHDVLMGRGSTIAMFEGNIRFREIVQSRKQEYVLAPAQRLKQEIAEQILEQIGSRGGRFLAKMQPIEMEAAKVAVTGKKAWTIVGDRDAVEKIKQALREKAFRDSDKPAAEAAAQPTMESPGRFRQFAPGLMPLALQSPTIARAFGWNDLATPFNQVVPEIRRDRLASSAGSAAHILTRLDALQGLRASSFGNSTQDIRQLWHQRRMDDTESHWYTTGISEKILHLTEPHDLQPELIRRLVRQDQELKQQQRAQNLVDTRLLDQLVRERRKVQSSTSMPGMNSSLLDSIHRSPATIQQRSLNQHLPSQASHHCTNGMFTRPNPMGQDLAHPTLAELVTREFSVFAEIGAHRGMASLPVPMQHGESSSLTDNAIRNASHHAMPMAAALATSALPRFDGLLYAALQGASQDDERKPPAQKRSLSTPPLSRQASHEKKPRGV